MTTCPDPGRKPSAIGETRAKALNVTAGTLVITTVHAAPSAPIVRPPLCEAEPWRITTPIEHAWAAEPPPAFPSYDAGSDGPENATRLLEATGRRWRAIAPPIEESLGVERAK